MVRWIPPLFSEGCLPSCEENTTLTENTIKCHAQCNGGNNAQLNLWKNCGNKFYGIEKETFVIKNIKKNKHKVQICFLYTTINNGGKEFMVVTEHWKREGKSF